jgi:hypothetical protein
VAAPGQDAVRSEYLAKRDGALHQLRQLRASRLHAGALPELEHRDRRPDQLHLLLHFRRLDHHGHHGEQRRQLPAIGPRPLWTDWGARRTSRPDNVPNNRITASGVTYDNNGNLTPGFGNIGPVYDAANRVSQVWMNGQPNTVPVDRLALFAGRQRRHQRPSELANRSPRFRGPTHHASTRQPMEFSFSAIRGLKSRGADPTSMSRAQTKARAGRLKGTQEVQKVLLVRLGKAIELIDDFIGFRRLLAFPAAMLPNRH